jgi:hypothetical protein
MGIDPQFDLWNYFFHVQRPQDPNAELTVSGGTVIHVMPRHGVNPYFNILMPRSMKGWRKKWFYLRNDGFAMLLTFTGSRPVPLSSWRDGVARRDLGKLQPMCEVLQQSRQEGLTWVHLMWMFLVARSSHSGCKTPRCGCI